MYYSADIAGMQPSVLITSAVSQDACNTLALQRAFTRISLSSASFTSIPSMGGPTVPKLARYFVYGLRK